ncbi:hypothetical protein D3C74_328800 [compost metagenome]
MLTGCDGIAIRCINNDDPALCSSFQINVIYTNTCTSNHFKVGTRRHNTICNTSLATNQEGIIITNNGNKFIFTKTGFLLNNNIICIHQLLDTEITDWVRH